MSVKIFKLLMIQFDTTNDKPMIQFDTTNDKPMIQFDMLCHINCSHIESL